MTNLLSSAPTLESINEAANAFYMGSTKTLVQISEGLWAVHNANGTKLEGVQVAEKGKRYRFEMI